ncbi:flagellar biosynthetic protein FliO [Tissierella praeacuta]|uniref:flagellar biosynthetic protein FliO n=1 Tax=Tissierella praeacuta TaxID=43131 RepID=UPI001C10A92E|nr:flagellar biosynthetic protein FliO [Tissierella praeacuta]MBU5254767.1 flagellar biosynthetic protein FliO [Tissierella praeacuta]
MNKKTNILVVLIFLTLYGLPVHAIEVVESSPIKIVFQLIFYITMFTVVIFLTIWGTKIVAKNYKGFTSSKYIDLLDVMNLSSGCKIVITRINQKIYILAVTNNNTNIIDVIEADEFPIREEKFNEYLNNYLDKNGNIYKINKKIESLFSNLKDKEGKKDEKKH